MGPAQEEGRPPRGSSLRRGDELLQFAPGRLWIKRVGRNLVDDAPILGGDVQRESLIAVDEHPGKLTENLAPRDLERFGARGLDLLVDRGRPELAEVCLLNRRRFEKIEEFGGNIRVLALSADIIVLCKAV